MKNYLMSYVKFMHYKIIDNYRAILRQLWNCKISGYRYWCTIRIDA